MNSARSLRRAGERWAFARLGGAGLAVVGHHRVAEPDLDPWDLALSVADFDRHVQSLNDAGGVVRLSDELDRGRWALGRDARVRFALTSDDGYLDNLTSMLPILERHDAPAVVFVATAFLGRPYFWWDRVAALAFSEQLTRDPEAAVRAGIVDGPAFERAASAHERHDVLYDALVWKPLERIEEATDRLSDELGCAPASPADRPMTSEELVELGSHPLVDIGVHTHEHRRLAALSPDQMAAQMSEGKAALDRLLGPSDRLLAYPYGDWSAGVVRVARRCGFRYAFTTESGVIKGGDDVLALPRVTPQRSLSSVGVAG